METRSWWCMSTSNMVRFRIYLWI